MNQGPQGLNMSALATAVLNAAGGARFGPPRFRYDCELFRGGVKVDEWSAENVVTTEGGTDLVNKYFKGSGYTAAWYLGLISSVSYASTPDIADVAANLGGTTNGWAECSASYAPNYDTPAGTNRAAITFGSPSGTDPVQLSSASTIDITFSENGTVKGAFIAAGTTRLSTTAPLYSAALFAADKTVADNDQLRITVTCTVDLVYTP